MKPAIRVLVVDDYQPWRQFVLSMFQAQPQLQIIGETADGLEAVDKAQALQPDLILLDIGLPTLNGIEAARRIRSCAPQSRILFVSENRSPDVAEEALRAGAGYVVKSDAANELLPAVEAVLQGKRYISARLSDHRLIDPAPEPAANHPEGIVAPLPLTTQEIARHEVAFFSDDRRLLDELTPFVEKALRAGNSAIVIATESHRNSLLHRLQGVDIGAAIEQGRYIALDAAQILSTFMVNGMPDPVRFLEQLGDLIVTATEAAKGTQPRVSLFGEGVDLLWREGNAQAAIQIEKLCNKLATIHDVHILCGYSLGAVDSRMDSRSFQQICAEHSAVYSR